MASRARGLPWLPVLTQATLDTGANASAEGGDDEALEDTAVKVNNIVHSFRLQNTSFDKKSYLSYLKGAHMQIRLFATHGH